MLLSSSFESVLPAPFPGVRTSEILPGDQGGHEVAYQRIYGDDGLLASAAETQGQGIGAQPPLQRYRRCGGRENWF